MATVVAFGLQFTVGSLAAAPQGKGKPVPTFSGPPSETVAWTIPEGRVAFAAGFGERQVESGRRVDADTVFELASLSKPIGATVVAAVVGDVKVAWDDRVIDFLPSFALSDPWVISHLTIADLYARRSGLPDHAGDLLEDLGYDRAQVLARLRFYPLLPFRSTW